MIADLPSLIARVERLEGPDREVDAAVWWHFEARKGDWPKDFTQINGRMRDGLLVLAPRLTASLDAVVALVARFERIIGFAVYMRDGEPDACVWFSEADPLGPRHIDAFDNNARAPANLALALLLALLRAVQAMKQETT